jgi:hypothetical protein
METKDKMYIKEVKTLAFLIKKDGRTVLISKSADKNSGKYICIMETLFGVRSELLSEVEINHIFGITLPRDFVH